MAPRSASEPASRWSILRATQVLRRPRNEYRHVRNDRRQTPGSSPLPACGVPREGPPKPVAGSTPPSPRRRGGVELEDRRRRILSDQSLNRMNTQLLIQLLVNGLVVGTLYGVVAMSFVLIYKETQVVNFAQGELLLIGAWVCWLLLTKYQVPFAIGMPLTLIFMFAFGIAIQILILRPMIGEPIISVIMVTIALSTVFQASLKWILGANPQPSLPVFPATR